MAVEIVRGNEVVVEFQGERCIHSRHCVLDRPDVFVPNVQGEWIHPERATPAQLLELAHNCPSGAIRCTKADGSAVETAPLVNTMRVRENGPLAFRAALSIDGQEVGYRATLCRCGASTHKPYCDNSHTTAGFTASGEPATTESTALARRDGTLKVEPIANGPLRVIGSVELLTGTGKTINRVTEATLCRCGQSGKKPYCDGTHERVGFRS